MSPPTPKTLEERVAFLERSVFGGTPCSASEFAALVPCAAGKDCRWLPGTAASNHVFCPPAPFVEDPAERARLMSDVEADPA